MRSGTRPPPRAQNIDDHAQSRFIGNIERHRVGALRAQHPDQMASWRTWLKVKRRSHVPAVWGAGTVKPRNVA
jgi:hypothetical protein